MNDGVRLSIDIEIAAKKLVSQIQMDNRSVEETIAKGIENAIEEVFREPAQFEAMVQSAIRDSIMSTVNSVLVSYELKKKISQTLTNAVEEKLTFFAGEIGAKIENVMNEELNDGRDTERKN